MRCRGNTTKRPTLGQTPPGGRARDRARDPGKRHLEDFNPTVSVTFLLQRSISRCFIFPRYLRKVYFVMTCPCDVLVYLGTVCNKCIAPDVNTICGHWEHLLGLHFLNSVLHLLGKMHLKHINVDL